MAKTQSGSKYLKSAPKPLVTRHESRQNFPGRDILGRLLTDPRMSRSWTVLRSRVTKPSQWERLWKEITLILRRAREEPKTRRKEQTPLLKIAKQADALAHSIEGGSLDLPAYQLFPDEVMSILGVSNWASLDDFERATIAQDLLWEWPTAPELLTELAAYARHLATEKTTEKRVVERATRDRESLYFVRDLGAFFNSEYDTPLYGTIARIASVVLGRKVTKKFVEKALSRAL